MYPSEPDSRMPGCGGTSVFTSTMSPSSQRNESESFGKQLPLGSLVKQPMIWPFELMPFYYLCSILDGFSRFLVHWDLRESMREVDIEVILARAKEKYSEAKPRIISDNGPRFIARDFKEFIRISGMTHVRTSPSYPQSKDYASYCTSLVRPGRIWSFSDLRESLRP
jgi:transposase InsO family protein